MEHKKAEGKKITPDYRKACKCAARALARVPRPLSFPLDLNTLIAVYPDIGLISYSVFCRTHGLSIAEAIAYLGSEYGSSFAMNEKTIICFNDLFENKGAVRFTCAHELGHILSGHFKIEAELDDKTYIALEKEANCFARNLLMPHFAVRRAQSLNAGEEISFLFGVSAKAAALRLSYLKTDESMSPASTTSFIFSSGRVCRSCGEISSDGICCSRCGKFLENSAINLSLEKTPAAIHNNCIMCGRESTGVNCAFCGFPALNLCASCMRVLEANALYCHDCGGKSIYNETMTRS